MNEDSSRREFLRNASLAGAALVAGGSVAGVAGCAKNQVEIDQNGCLFVKDKELAATLYEQWRAQNKPETGPRKGICVRFPDPSSPGNKVNSLCDC